MSDASIHDTAIKVKTLIECDINILDTKKSKLEKFKTKIDNAISDHSSGIITSSELEDIAFKIYKKL